VPEPPRGNPAAGAAPLLEVLDLKKHYPVRQGVLARVRAFVHAVDGISFTVAQGETLGLVGESGCGKSTAGKVILGLIPPTAGSVRLEGQEILGLGRRAMHAHRRHLQVIFQDPYASLNPRQPAGAIVGEPLANYGLAPGRARPSGSPRCSSGSASGPSRCVATRTSSRAASASGSGSRARSRSAPS
jgi:peptide/nickel transport system ATP-binding protein/oligopeptide transport system ATP-binding protein